MKFLQISKNGLSKGFQNNTDTNIKNKMAVSRQTHIKFDFNRSTEHFMYTYNRITLKSLSIY